jgi:hypothetical protein
MLELNQSSGKWGGCSISFLSTGSTRRYGGILSF